MLVTIPPRIPGVPAVLRRLTVASTLTFMGAIFGLMVMAPPAGADGQTEQQVSDGCTAANGTYSNQGGNGTSSCCHTDNNVVQYCDYYTSNGNRYFPGGGLPPGFSPGFPPAYPSVSPPGFPPVYLPLPPPILQPQSPPGFTQSPQGSIHAR